VFGILSVKRKGNLRARLQKHPSLDKNHADVEEDAHRATVPFAWGEKRLGRGMEHQAEFSHVNSRRQGARRAGDRPFLTGGVKPKQSRKGENEATPPPEATTGERPQRRREKLGENHNKRAGMACGDK